MILIAESDYGWGGPVEPWEIHPALYHLPIEFLLGGVALDLYAWWRGQPSLAQLATGLLLAGVLSGISAALAGILAFYTLPAHTDEAHRRGCLRRWRNWIFPPTAIVRFVECFAALLLLVGSELGGYLVYHGGAGIDVKLLASAVREGHSHGSTGANHGTTSNHNN